jgi:hypothetical protein
MELISDPRNLYEDRYYDLINKNHEYNSLGNKQTLFNEMLTVYKLYFDKSIFQAIKNIIPARANLFTGVVIEPTILERPKYQNRPIISNLASTPPGVIGNLYQLSMSVLWADFSSGSFVGYKDTIDLGYLTNPNRIMPINFDNGISGYVTDFMDKVQLGYYPNFEIYPRLWESVGSAPVDWPVDGIAGSTTYDLNSNGRFIITSSQNTRLESSDPISAGYNYGPHQILYYMMKAWDKYYYYSKTGEYVRSLNPNDNAYSSESVYLYKYIIVSEPLMRELVYWYNNTIGSTINTDPSFNYFAPNYYHNSSTFKGTPNLKISNVSIVPGMTFPGNLSDFTWNINPTSRYFEIVSGYPRNHYTHKMEKFSKQKYGKYYYINYNLIYVKGRNTIDTTVDTGGINDGTYPVSSNNVSNVNVINTGNVIQYVPTENVGTLIPGAKATINSNSSTGGTTTVSTILPPSTGGTPVGGTAGSSTKPSAGCLLAGTQIMMFNGYTKNIEDVKVGDILMSYRGLTVKVTKLLPNRYHTHYILNGKLKITFEHPIMIAENGVNRLVIVKHLRIGDKLVKYDGTTETLNTIVIVPKETPTYNFSVSNSNLYIADGIVVHNASQQVINKN